MALKGAASEKQKDFLLELGYAGDVEKLSKAQASLIIDKLIEQRDEREGRRSKPQRGSYLVPASLGCLVILIAPLVFAWLFGALPWNDGPPAHVAAPPAEPPRSVEPPPEEKKPVTIMPPEPIRVPTEKTPTLEAEPVPEPSPPPTIDPVTEPEPVDPRVHVFEDATGQFRVKARLKSLANGVVTIVKEDGKEVKVPIEQLSEESARWVRDVLAKPKNSGTP